MISHQHQNMAKDMDGVDEVAEEEVEEECINIKQTSYPEESDLKLYCHALYHQINLKLYLLDNRLKMCCNALYHQINLRALPTRQQAQDVPQCSVPLNQPQALPTRQQAQDVP